MSKINQHLFRQTVIVIVCCFSISSLQAQKSIFDYLSGTDLVEITLKANFDSITLDKFSEEYLEATLQRKGDPKIWELKIKTRGKFRRRICQFPPLKLEFSKKDLEAMGLAKFDDLKLVTHCLDDILAQEYVLREYLAYKMYQTLTPYSFRVQLAKITYVNTGKRSFQLKRYGLLIEDEDDLAHRIGGKPQDVFGLSWDKIHPSSAETLAAFQYIVGNTDWDITMQRNVAFIQSSADSSIISVPYDFDMSGLVNPVYGIPNPDLPIKTLQERYYQGGSKPSAELTNAILSQKENWIAMCRNFKLLPSTTRREMQNFLASFFQELETGAAFTKP